jgi:hypothetical protein
LYRVSFLLNGLVKAFKARKAESHNFCQVPYRPPPYRFSSLLALFTLVRAVLSLLQSLQQEERENNTKKKKGTAPAKPRQKKQTKRTKKKRTASANPTQKTNGKKTVQKKKKKRTASANPRQEKATSIFPGSSKLVPLAIDPPVWDPTKMVEGLQALR